MRIIHNFKKKFISLLDDLYDTFPLIKYKDNKQKIENLETLKIISNKNDINLREQNDSLKYFIRSCLWGAFFKLLIDNLKISKCDYIIIIYLFILFISVSIIYCYIVRFFICTIPIIINWCSKFFKNSKLLNKLLNISRKYSLILLLIIVPLITSNLFNISISKPKELKNDYIIFYSCIIVTLCLYFIIKYSFYFKTWPTYQLEMVNYSPTIILLLISIGNPIVSNFLKNNKWSLLVFITVVSTIVKTMVEYQCKKRQEKAQMIFEYQSLLEQKDINYSELKRCYYYGGEEYKNKMLSIEKISMVVLEKELSSYISLDQLIEEDYRIYYLYKAFKYKTFLLGQAR